MPLFEISKPAGLSLVPPPGLARTAAGSPSLGGKQSVEYFSLGCRSILNRCTSARVPFRWTINPYRGCEFGCRYCYARYTHEFLGMEESKEFEEKIYSKDRAAEILRKELGKGPRGAIAIGTATDPYQPAERRFQTTRSILAVLAEFRGLHVSLTTKSDLVRRDLDLLSRIGRDNDLQVNISVTTLRRDLARCLEVRAPRPGLRLEAAAALSRAGVPVAIFAMPVLPAITDHPKDLEAVAQAAARAGAVHFAANALFLMPSAQKAFFPFLEKEFPALVQKYRHLYERGAYLGPRYQERLQALAEKLRLKYGLTGRHRPYPAEAFAPTSQMRLFAEERIP